MYSTHESLSVCLLFGIRIVDSYTHKTLYWNSTKVCVLGHSLYLLALARALANGNGMCSLRLLSFKFNVNRRMGLIIDTEFDEFIHK